MSLFRWGAAITARRRRARSNDGGAPVSDPTGATQLASQLIAEGASFVAAYLAEEATVDGSNNVTGWPEHLGSGADLVLQGAVDGLLTQNLAGVNGPFIKNNVSNTGLALQSAAFNDLVEGLASVFIMTEPQDVGVDNVMIDMSEGTGLPTRMQNFFRPAEGLLTASSDTIPSDLAIAPGAYADGARHVFRWARTFDTASATRIFEAQVDEDAPLVTSSGGAVARAVSANRIDVFQHRSGSTRLAKVSELSSVLVIGLPVDVPFSAAMQSAIVSWARAYRGVPTP